MKNKHKMNQHPDAQLVRTPVYASLNVLGGHTVSKRDDLEACLYIIFELILQIVDYSVSSQHVFHQEPNEQRRERQLDPNLRKRNKL